MWFSSLILFVFFIKVVVVEMFIIVFFKEVIVFVFKVFFNFLFFSLLLKKLVLCLIFVSVFKELNKLVIKKVMMIGINVKVKVLFVLKKMFLKFN